MDLKKLTELPALVEAMREAQKRSFKSRTQDDLKDSIILEKRVDAAVVEILKEGQIVWPEEVPHDP